MICKECGSSMDGNICSRCGYDSTKYETNNPDISDENLIKLSKYIEESVKKGT